MSALFADSLSIRQAKFAAALLDPERSVPWGLVGPDGKSSTRRFNVYRNNVVAGLTQVLREAFPATARIVGEEFFAGMARIYVAREPPASPMLFEYGEGFAHFILSFEPVAALLYLADVARIERAWVEAYHAPEALPLDPVVFADLSPDRLANLRIVRHPSLRIVRSRFPALTIWRTNIPGAIPESVNLDAGGQDILIVRPDSQVEWRALSAGSADFLQALCAGHTVLEATEAAMTADHRFDLSVSLTALLGVGAFIDFDAPRHPREPSLAGGAS